MKALTFLFAALLSASATAAPSVATLGRTEGVVLVNQGKQFVSTPAGQLLVAGDRVLVMQGGQASLRFTDGCVLPVASGSLLTVPAKSTCAGRIANVTRVATQTAQVDSGSNQPVSNGETLLYVAGAVVVVAALAGNSDSSDDTVSP